MNKKELLLINKKLDLIIELQLENLKEKSSLSIVKYYNTYEDLQEQEKELNLK